MTDRADRTRLIPLGGVGEFGANATIVQSQTTTIVVDFGLMFPPDTRFPGVDYYVIDVDMMADEFPTIDAIYLTHGHEDHIGGLPFLLARYNVPVYTLPYTAGLIKKALDYEPHLDDVDLRTVELNTPVTTGDIQVEFIGVTHSIVQAASLHIKTPHGAIVHTGDFKVDPLPEDNYPFQSERFAALGDEGVDLLIMDSTNASKRGFCPSDYQIMPNLEDIILRAHGRVFLTTFSSNMPRINKLKHVARKTGRKIVFVGRGFHKHFQLSIDNAYMPYWPDVFATMEEAANLPDEELIYIVTGSQGEQSSALMRIMRGSFKGLSFQAGDTMIFSSRTIPGNERKIALMVSDMRRDGITVIVERDDSVHTSGHGYREDIAYMMSLVRPRYVAPIHGEFNQLNAHHTWLQQITGDNQQVLMIEDGDVLELDGVEVRLTGHIPTEMIPIDGNQNLPLDRRVLSERKDMMYSGMILINAVVRPHDDIYDYQISTAGLVDRDGEPSLKAVQAALTGLRLEHGQDDDDVWLEEITRTVKRTLRRSFVGRPLLKVVLNGRIVR